MLKREEGSAIVMTMVILLFLSSLVAASSVTMVNDIKNAKLEEDRMKAFYIAEAGVEAVIHEFNNQMLSKDFSKKKLFSISSEFDGGKYEVKDVKLIDSESTAENKVYDITVKGKVNENIEKDITIRINRNITLTHTVVSGGKVNNKITHDFWFIGEKTLGKVEIEDNDKVEGANIPKFKFDSEDYGITEKEDHNPGNSKDKRYFKSGEFLDKNKNPWYIADEWFDGKIGADINLPGGETFYHEGDLNLGIADIYGGYDSNGKLPSKDSGDIEPTVIVVNGNLNFPDVYTHIYNVYFIVKGNAYIRGARLETQNTFIYAEKSINFNYANLSIFNNSSGFNYNGALMSEGDITTNIASLGSVIGGLLGFEITTGTIKSDDNLDSSFFFDTLEENQITNLKPVLISWEED
jgi:hypothetical protein